MTQIKTNQLSSIQALSTLISPAIIIPIDLTVFGILNPLLFSLAHYKHLH
jgi:hypothetical protein